MKTGDMDNAEQKLYYAYDKAPANPKLYDTAGPHSCDLVYKYQKSAHDCSCHVHLI